MQDFPILVFCPSPGNRVRYTFRFIFTDILGLAVKFTTDASEFNAFSGPKLSYANQPVGNEIFFQSRSLLSETGINQQNIVVSEWNGLKVFFSTGKNSALPFDPFAAAFYMVSRYEEYLPHLRDHYDRFETKESLAFLNGFVHRPVVDLYAMEIKKILEEKFPALQFPGRRYRYISTIDIDNAFAFREKGMVRGLGGIMRALYQLDLKELMQRVRVGLGMENDPYDTYDYLLKIQQSYKLEMIYFFLLADYGVNDKNVPYQSQRLQSLIRHLGDHAGIGIHPSFGSNSDKTKLKKEIDRLSAIIHSDVTCSRQHFLKLNFPQTYRNLIEMDITDDYTMGFAHEIGFRAGTCTPFTFYDLDLDTETKLRIHPFAVMDATLRYYMKVQPEDALKHIQPLIDEVKSVNGTFITLWHNESVGRSRVWPGWEKVYEQVVAAAVPN